MSSAAPGRAVLGITRKGKLLIGPAPTTRTSITVRRPSHVASDNELCSPTQIEVGNDTHVLRLPTRRKEQRNKLQNRTTTTMQRSQLRLLSSCGKWCVDATSPSQTTKDVIIEPRHRSVRLHNTVGAQKTVQNVSQPFHSAQLSQFLTMMMSMGYKTSPTQTRQLQKRINHAHSWS